MSRLSPAALWRGAICALCWPPLLAHAAQPVRLNDGDLIFQTSTSAQSVAIQQATASRWSHMGVIVYRNGKPYVLEAEAQVRYTPLAPWIARGKDGRYAVRRLREHASIDTDAAHARLRETASGMLGRSYDSTFEWSDQRLYCSELAWKLYQRSYGIALAPLSRLRDFKLDSAVVQAKMLERYHGKPPLDEPVIAPDAIYRSSLLITVVE
ncbi:YiiX family permuted papain-like enzyme [Dyella tabacisoli]|uniref:YiiX family permuted papain-like enzyme n=1 Tax=Dyella tabacisoli TaxID=2282381 RepID=A0A369UR16_9GAMM|nr:YiiX family permuted papain-like enzyme [Dyella tabacisoli]RDD83204.1 YiiX family permuted papain-like enzyme [Dyella tabacisoli]